MKKEKIVELIKKYTLKPSSQRNLPFLTQTIVNLGYTVLLRKRIGVSYEAIGILGKKDYFHTMYNEEKVGEQTKNYLRKNRQNLHKELISLQQDFKKIKINIDFLNKDKKLDPKNRLGRIIKNYISYMEILAVYNCFWRYLGNREQDEFLSANEIKDISKQRDVVARLYPQVETLIKDCTDLIGKKEGFDGDLLRYFSFYELKDYLNKNRINKQILEDLDKRRKGYFHLFIEEGNQSINITDKKIIDKIRKEFFDVDRNIKEVKGFSSYNGKVRGIVFNMQENDKPCKENYIIVVGSTHPDQVSIIKNSVAIVTDEGGILSHAAIISREFKIPCIIGTKIATKLFKDGDYIEVDANKGIARKIDKDDNMAKNNSTKIIDRKIREEQEKKLKDTEKSFDEKDILWFKDISITDIPLVGGKGASLGELFEVAPIPDGFVITARVFNKFLNPIKEKIMDILDILDVEDTKKLDKASKEIKELILEEDFPSELKKEILKSYESLQGFVAVRSSATAEDLPTASFAGQQDTYLNIKGDDLLESVQKCWASLFNSRAIYYREKNNFKHEDVLIAVVVQKMVDSQKAGVMFTANVVTNSKKEIIIEGAFGLGEYVVSGQVTPDYYLIDKKTESVKEKNINIQEFGLFRKKEGGTEKRTVKNPEDSVLTDLEIKELTRLGLEIEKHYKHPQDIEWGIDGKGKIYILQSRPITTLR